MGIRLQTRRIWLLLAPILALLAVNEAPASTVKVGEERIISLANAPAVLKLQGMVDAAGRPLLVATLNFANACYAESGVQVLAGQARGGVPHAIILQRFDPAGCPDIFQPEDRRASILLPSAHAGQGVRVIGRPATADVAHPLPFEAERGEGLDPSALVIESEPFASGAPLPAYRVGGLALRGSGPGYRLIGKVSLAQGCGPEVVGTHVFEVPDLSGRPAFDVVVLTAPERCASGEEMVDLSVSIATPQAPAGRFVYIVNEADPRPRPLD